MLQPVPLSTEDLEFQSPIEWEEREEGFFLENLWLTFKKVLSAPQTFFENLRRNGTYWKPLTFAILMELFVIGTGSLLWGGLLSGFFVGGTGQWGILGANFKIFTLVFGLLGLVLALVISSFVYYLTAVMLGARSGFRTLFRMVAYTEGAVVFRLIPYIGTAITEIYRLFLLYFGFRKVYRFSALRACAATLIPLVILVSVLVVSGLSLYQVMKI